MGRPQEVDVEELLDHARDLWQAGGMGALTIRALAARAGISNGAIYHNLGSRAELLGRVWAREAGAFRAFQEGRITLALATGTAVDGVVAAALATGGYADVPGGAPRVLASSRPQVFMSDAVPEELREQLLRHREAAAAMFADLADRLWGRRDEVACRLVRICVADIPARVFMAAPTVGDPLVLHAVEAAVRGVLGVPPPPSS